MVNTLDECRARLISTVQRIVEESGNPEGFDPVAWTDHWMTQPIPASMHSDSSGPVFDVGIGRIGWAAPKIGPNIWIVIVTMAQSLVTFLDLGQC
jgi:hypothetical protein